MSATDRQAPIVAAVLQALGQDSPLSALVGQRLYDAPPAQAVMPSVTIRAVTARDDSTADTEAQSFTFDLDVWDRYAIGADLGGPRAIMGHIRRILHMRALSVPDVAVLTCRCSATQGPFRDPDEVTLHGIVTMTVLAGHEAAFA